MLLRYRLRASLIGALAVASAASLLAQQATTPSQENSAETKENSLRNQTEAVPADADATPKTDTTLLSGLAGSKHDFSQSERLPRDMCLPCHAPHLPFGEPPLLDERETEAQPLPTYQARDVELDRASLLCVSCHDGVIATDVYTSGHSTGVSNQLGGSQLGQAGLTGHPVGILYPTADPKYNSAAAVTADGLLDLPGGRVQCTTCHDPHNAERNDGFLVKSNERSRLCLSCHRM